MEFDFNIKKGRETICFFIFSSLVLFFLIVDTDNKISNYFSDYPGFKYFFISIYFSILMTLVVRCLKTFFGWKPKIQLNDNALIFPTYYFGIKELMPIDIYSVENIYFKKKRVAIVLGIRNKSRIFLDKNCFKNPCDFNIFLNVILEIVRKNSDPETNVAIKNISISQEKKKPICTYLVYGICVLIFFLATSLSFKYDGNYEFVLKGAGTKNFIYTGELYRLFSSAFIHISIIHLLLNLFVFGVLGELIERVISCVRFLNIFLLSCLLSYFSFLLFSGKEMGAGASGGIFGLWGAYFCLKMKYEEYLPGTVNAIPLKRLLWILVIEFFLEIFVFKNVGIYVHLGGFITGFVYLFLAPLGPRLETVDKPVLFEKILFVVLVAAYSVGLSYFLLSYYELI